MCFFLLRVYFGKRNDNGGGGGDNIKSKRCIAIVVSIFKKIMWHAYDTAPCRYPFPFQSSANQTRTIWSKNTRAFSCNHSVLSHVNLYQSSQALPSQSSKQKPVVYLQGLLSKTNYINYKAKTMTPGRGKIPLYKEKVFSSWNPFSNPQESHPNNRIKDHGFSWIFTAAKTASGSAWSNFLLLSFGNVLWPGAPGGATQKWGQKHGIKTTNGSLFFLNGANKQKVEGFCHDTCLAGLPSNFWGIKHSLDTGMGPIFWCPMHRHRHRICFHFRCAIRSSVFHRTSSSS